MNGSEAAGGILVRVGQGIGLILPSVSSKWRELSQELLYQLPFPKILLFN